MYIALKYPEKIAKTLVEKYGFKLKGGGELLFHLDCYFKSDKKSTLYYGYKSYIDKMVSTFKKIFNTEATPSSLPPRIRHLRILILMT